MESQDITTLAEARKYLQENRGKGVVCPCCRRFTKIYQRRIYAGMAEFLQWIVKAYSEKKDVGAYIDITTGPNQRGGDFAKLAHWGLIERKAIAKGNEKLQRWWRPTLKGIEFVEDKVRVPEYALVCGSELVGFSDETVSIRDCLQGGEGARSE